MKKLEEIVKNAVGIDTTRKDQFSIVNLSFETKELDGTKEENGGSFLDNVNKFSNVILILVAIGASIFILRNLMMRVKNEKMLLDGTAEQPESRLTRILQSKARLQQTELKMA